MTRFTALSIFLAALILVGGCSSIKTSQKYAYTNNNQDVYTSAFPSNNVSGQLRRIQQSLARVISQATYTMYRFKYPYVTLEMIKRNGGPDGLAAVKSTYQTDKAGTAVCILNNNNHAVFLTAKHILAYPDTLISYRHSKNIPKKKYISSIGIRKGHQSSISIASNIFHVHIFATAKYKDLELLVSSDRGINLIPPLPISAGNAKRLRTGSFVYILGYPLGVSIVTRAIVSNPNYDGYGSFLTDAVSNHGVSGGLIIATDDNYHSFEWVGMAISAFASRQLYLIPDPSRQGTYWNHEIYTDTIYIAKKRTISYGLMNAISINEIVSFLFLHNNKLKKLGLATKRFF